MGSGWIFDSKMDQICINIGLKIDVNFERQIFKKTFKKQWMFNDFCGLVDASWVRKSIEIGSKIEFNFGRHLGIDFDEFGFFLESSLEGKRI